MKAPLRSPKGFSLTEVVIALGVATVAFTSIIALFPLGLTMSKESFESTQAALIAKSIMSQIVDVQGTTTNTGSRLITTGTNNDPSNSPTAKFKVGSYLNSTNIYLAYTYATNNDGRNFWKPSFTNGATGIPQSAWEAGVPNSVALARITLNRLFTEGATYDIHLVEVQVDYPGNLARTNRTREIFARVAR